MNFDKKVKAGFELDLIPVASVSQDQMASPYASMATVANRPVVFSPL